MANLLDNVENSVWHAFDYLALEGDGTATKLKLKVRHILKNSNIYSLKSALGKISFIFCCWFHFYGFF